VNSEGVERRLAAILSADVVGYSRLMSQDEADTIRILGAYRDEIGLLVRQHRGRVVDTVGDSLLAEFPTATDAVECAVEVQRIVGVRNVALPAERRMEFRIGIHLGEVRVDGDRIYGDGVNIAARLEGLAEAGGICISRTVHEQIEGKLDLRCEDLGEQSLKNIPKPVRVFRVEMAAATAPPETPRRSLRRAVLATGLVVLLGAAAVAGWRIFADRPVEPTPGATLAPIRSIAVLPLLNLSGDPEQEYFADGMTEALIGDLAKIASLRVISRTSSMRYKDSQKALPEIARELNVDAVIEGGVLRAGQRVRVTAQLIHAPSDEHLWAEHYERDYRDILALQGELARSIAAQVEIELTPDEESRLTGARAVNPEAHEAVLRGSYFINQYTEKAIKEGLRYFERALELDPDYAPAYAALAGAYTLLAMADAAAPSEVLPRAKAAALKALEIDDALSDAHLSMGVVLFGFDWDWEGGERELRRAIELDPSDASFRFNYSALLCMLGRHEEALVEIERAVAFNPWDLLTNTHAGYPYYMARQYDRAIVEFEKALELDPTFYDTHRHLGWAYIHKGMLEDAIAAQEKAVLFGGGTTRQKAGLAYAYGIAGRTAEAVAIIEELKRRSGSRYVSSYHVAIAHVGLGQTDEAFEWLEKAYEMHDTWLVELAVEPALDPLRSDPRFQKLLRRIGFPES
jgi:TolB-like protein/class 3 adenylate cyclase/Tfp pilus assembly protein PilF